MRIILVYQKVEPLLKPLIAEMEKSDYTFLEFTMADEIDQLGKQMGKVVVLFTDPKLSYKFLKENNLEGLDTYRLLYLPKIPPINKENQARLSGVELHVHAPSTYPKLRKDINNFYENKLEDRTGEIEFLVQSDQEKK